jgi:hypothetical protein
MEFFRFLPKWAGAIQKNAGGGSGTDNGGRIDVESLLLLEARSCAGESDGEIVAGAWDFGRINQRYARHLKLLKARPIVA